MMKVFNKKVAVLSVLSAVSFSMMSFNESDSTLYGTSDYSNEVTGELTDSDEVAITAAARVVVGYTRIVSRAITPGIEEVALLTGLNGYANSENPNKRDYQEIDEIKECKLNSLG